jgi:hypothetical protein
LIYRILRAVLFAPSAGQQSERCSDAQQLSLAAAPGLLTEELRGRPRINGGPVSNMVQWCNGFRATCRHLALLSGLQCRAGQCRAVQCSAVQCSAVQCSAVQCSAVQWCVVRIADRGVTSYRSQHRDIVGSPAVKCSAV